MTTVPPPPDPGARRSLRRRLLGGPVARRVAGADLRVYRAVRHDAQVAAITPAVRIFSAAGEHAACWLAIAGAGAVLDPARRGRWLRAGATIGGTYALNTAIKQVVRRRRPAVEDLPALIATPSKLSFPSAHASSSFAAARSLSRLGLLPGPPLLAAATLMGASRVYLGVHYPSDIVAGALLGLTVATIVARP